jgi:hypothetical protein
MGPKTASVLILIAGAMLSLPAQAQQYGYGLYGGTQPCGYPQASALPPEDPQLASLKKEQAHVREDKSEDSKRVRELERKKEKYDQSISEVISSDWAQAVTEHLDRGYNCSCPGAQPAMDPDVLPPPAPPRTGRHDRLSQNTETKKSGRAPASAYEDTQAPDSAGPHVNPYDKTWFGGAAAGNGQPSNDNCAPPDDLHNSQPWKTVCLNGGGVTKAVCHNHYFANPGVTGDGLRSCDDAIEHYRNVNNEIEQLKRKIDSEGEQITALTKEIRMRSREVEKEQKTAGGKSSFNWASLIPAGLGLLAGAGAEYMGYQNYKANNTYNTALSREGMPTYPTQPYQFGSQGYPFVQAGIYGSIASAQSGAYGCNGGMIPGANGMPGMPNFNQGAFQNYMPNYQTSLYGSGAFGARYPGYLGLGQSLSVPTSTVYTTGR